MSSHDFHSHFSGALRDPDRSGLTLQKADAARRSERRFNVYRNNRVVSLIESLRAIYPATARLVGDEFFKASARAYVDQSPPSQPVMAEYGEDFGAFLGRLPTTSNLPFLERMAELEWLRLQAFHSADAPALAVSSLADVDPHALMNAQLVCHPALRTLNAEWPVYSLWRNCTLPAEDETEVNMRMAETVVITRPEWQVHCHTLTPAEWDFVDALMREHSIGTAAARALENAPGFDVGPCLIRLLEWGVFNALNTH